MHIGFYNHTKAFNKNRMFLDPNSWFGDNLVYPFVFLGTQLKKMGHKVNTIDMDKLENFDAIVFIEFPGINNPYFKKLIKNDFKNIYLIAQESPIIKPDNLDTKNHAHFKKVFTWNDPVIDNKKYFKLNYSHDIPKTFNFKTDKKNKLCTIIAGNKLAKHQGELYSERVKAIRWFERHHLEDFDLFGIGWDRYNFHGTFLGINIARLNRLTFLTKLLKPNYPSYKGKVKSKNETYKKYKFSICYENVRDIEGYITEKIFDCFLAGCVPIYLGASNITDHIPSNTFIDKRNFDTYEKLYSYIKNMPDKDYLDHINNIKLFLTSQKAYPFSAQYFADTIIKQITNE